MQVEMSMEFGAGSVEPGMRPIEAKNNARATLRKTSRNSKYWNANLMNDRKTLNSTRPYRRGRRISSSIVVESFPFPLGFNKYDILSC